MAATIKEQLAAAVAARQDSIKALRARIIDLLEPVPAGVKLIDDSGKLVAQVVHVFTGASQWSNRTWNVTIEGWAVVDAGGLLIAEERDSSYWDGDNMHYRKGEPTCLGRPGTDCEYERTELAWASGAVTREVALRLPEALARYMAECEAERVANEATLAQGGA